MEGMLGCLTLSGLVTKSRSDLVSRLGLVNLRKQKSGEEMQNSLLGKANSRIIGGGKRGW